MQVDHLTGPSSRSKDASSGAAVITTAAVVTGLPSESSTCSPSHHPAHHQSSHHHPSFGAGRGASGTVQIHPSDSSSVTTSAANVSQGRSRTDPGGDIELEGTPEEESAAGQLVTVRISKL